MSWGVRIQLWKVVPKTQRAGAGKKIGTENPAIVAQCHQFLREEN
jgi:broad specificity polyphosphatase/5'/3'-nucleotidase SurE